MAHVAKKTFRTARPDPRRFRIGQIVPDDDPAVTQWPHLFEHVDEVVERATANPGEKRITKAKKTTKKD